MIQNYYWPELKKMTKCYIQNCHICRYLKASKNQDNGLLKPLLILFFLYTNITSNFITSLPVNNSYNAILMIVDYLVKKKYYMLYTTDKNDANIKANSQFLLQNILKVYGFLLSLTLDKDHQFILGVWKNFRKVLDFFVNLSTFFYLKVDD